MGVCASTAGLEITANKSSAEEVYGVYGDQAESTSVSQRHTLTQSSRSNAALSRKLVRDNTGNEDGSRLHDHYELVGGKEGVLEWVCKRRLGSSLTRSRAENMH